jgi:hypothetical protein
LQRTVEAHLIREFQYASRFSLCCLSINSTQRRRKLEPVLAGFTNGQLDGHVVLSFVLELKDVDMSQGGVLRTFAQVAGCTTEGLSVRVKHANKAKKESSLKR